MGLSNSHTSKSNAWDLVNRELIGVHGDPTAKHTNGIFRGINRTEVPR